MELTELTVATLFLWFFMLFITGEGFFVDGEYIRCITLFDSVYGTHIMLTSPDFFFIFLLTFLYTEVILNHAKGGGGAVDSPAPPCLLNSLIYL